MLSITNFTVNRLPNGRSIRLKFNKNQLVLVGENGTGKSTVVNLLYLFLSHQWRRLNQYNFDTISFGYELDDEKNEITYSRPTLKNVPRLGIGKSKLFRRKMSALPYEVQTTISEMLHIYDIEEIFNNSILMDRLLQFGIPVSELLEIFDLYDGEDLRFLAEFNNSNPQDKITNQLNEVIDSQILYLPTYRRIERDLGYIFHEHDKATWQRLTARHASEHFLELVEFGMDDVKTSIDRVMHDLSSTLRQGLNQLTGNFLKEVVRREYREVDLQSVTNTEMSSVDAVLDRVGENLFSSDDKVRLKEIIKNVRNMDEINNEDKVILQFLLKLLALHEQQKLKESSVNKFVKVCNDYLISKHLVYDSQKFEVRIEQERISSRSQPSKVYLSDLSSGEKQIISLFAHIYLGTRKDYFVIIDEPELSLSVKWQKRFLPDVWATEKCRALVAVTHSPFIFDNSLRTYTHGIEEFWIKK